MGDARHVEYGPLPSRHTWWKLIETNESESAAKEVDVYAALRGNGLRGDKWWERG